MKKIALLNCLTFGCITASYLPFSHNIVATQTQNSTNQSTVHSSSNTSNLDATYFFVGKNVKGTIYYEINDTNISIVTGTEETGKTLNTLSGENVKLKNTIVIGTDTYSLSSIADYAFVNDTSITGNLNLSNCPDNILGGHVFEGCTNLSSITLPTNNWTVIPSYCFANCSNVSTINLPSSLISIGNYAFYHCSNIEAYDLYQCDKLSSIGTCAFSGYRNGSIHFDNGNQYFHWYYDDANADGSVLITADTLTWGENTTCVGGIGYGTIDFSQTTLTSLAPNAFLGCENISGVILPASLETINTYTFGGCTKLTTIDFSNTQLTQIPNYAFIHDTSLQSITFSNSITSIGDYAFSECSSLQIDNFPTSLATIGNYAFSECQGLTSFTLNDDIQQLGEGCFSSCDSLPKLDLSNCVKLEAISDACFANCKLIKQVVLSDNTKYLNNSAFLNCTNLHTINFPTSLITIGENTFQNCTYLQALDFSTSLSLATISKNAFSQCSHLKSIDLSTNTGLTTIDEQAFYQCYLLKTLSLPESITGIGADAFGCCPLQNIDYEPNDTCGYKKVLLGDNGLAYTTQTDGLGNWNNYSTVLGGLVCGDLSFNVCTNLTTIANNAFTNCYGIKSVTFDNNQITQIGTSAFKTCANLSKVDLTNTNNGLVISDDAFSECNLSSFSINTNWTNYQLMTFSDANEAIGYTLVAKNTTTWTDDTTVIGKLAVGKIILDQATKLTTLKTGVFTACWGITTLSLPYTCTSILASACNDCINLENVWIPGSVNTVGKDAFSDCMIQELTFGNTNPSWMNKLDVDWHQMSSIVSLGYSIPYLVIYVPYGYKTSYQSYINEHINKNCQWFDPTTMSLAEHYSYDSDLTKLGLALGLGLGIPFVVSVVLVSVYSYKKQHPKSSKESPKQQK